MHRTDNIFIAGHGGIVCSALVRRLQAEGFSNVVTRDRVQLDLTNDSAVAKFFEEERPAIVVVAAAKVGGITMPTNFCGSNDNFDFTTSVAGYWVR